jgi:hypothetical protein
MNLDRLEEVLGIQNIEGLTAVNFEGFFLNMMQLGDMDKRSLQEIPHYKEYLECARNQGAAFTILDNGEPIVCFGVVEQWPHVAECWLLPDVNKIKQWRIPFHKGSLNFMEEIAKELDLHRIHVTVDAANLVALKWIRAMKFQKEGLLKSYTYDKKDMIMYSRIFAR